jgi:glutaredoxin
MMRFLLGAAMTAMLLAAGPTAGQNGDKLYKWVDENGNVTYQDRPPPEQTGQVQEFEQSSYEAGAGGPDAAMPDVELVLYAIDECDVCDMVRTLLDERGLPFTEKDAQSDVEVQDELRQVSGRLSVPVLTIGEEVLTGYNRELILNELEDAGFPTEDGGGAAAQSGGDDGMTPEELEQAARNGGSGGEDDDPFAGEAELFDDTGGDPAGEDIFADSPAADSDDITQWEEIPEDERIRVGE